MLLAINQVPSGVNKDLESHYEKIRLVRAIVDNFKHQVWLSNVYEDYKPSLLNFNELDLLFEMKHYVFDEMNGVPVEL